MGSEASCKVRFGKQESEGKVLLETSEILFRGDFRLVLPFSELDQVEAAEGRLRLTHRGQTIEFALGPKAERWAAKIRNPRGLLDKLGVTPASRVGVLGVTDAGVPWRTA